MKYDRLIDIPFQRIATELGNILFANTVAVGVICGILDVSEELLFTETKSYYFSKGEDIAVKNTEAVKLIVIEQNETGQFADLIKLETGIDIKDRILKWNGMPFSVEEIANALKNT